VTGHAGTKVFFGRIPRTLPLLTLVTTHQISCDLGKRFLGGNAIMTQPCSCDREQHAVMSVSLAAGPNFRFAPRTSGLRSDTDSRALSEREAYRLLACPHYLVHLPSRSPARNADISN
jgi:hypothetical protein